MLNFGQRSIFRQGGSFLISLPMQWVKTTNPVKVKIEMDKGQRIIITSVPQARQDLNGTEDMTPTKQKKAHVNGRNNAK